MTAASVSAALSDGRIYAGPTAQTEAKTALSSDDPLTVSRLGMDVHVQRLEREMVLPALALFDLENDPTSGWQAGDFQQSQNEDRIDFLEDAIREHGAEAHEVTEPVDAAEAWAFYEDQIEAAGGSVLENGMIVLPEGSTLDVEEIRLETMPERVGDPLPPEEFRVLGYGTFIYARRYMQYDHYPEFHDPERSGGSSLFSLP